MEKSLGILRVALAVIPFLFSAIFAGAELIPNGDFSTGDLSGWVIQGNLIESDYANIPLAYKNTWDLSEWNNKLLGSFAFFENPFGGLYGKTAMVTDCTSLVLSLDYAVAWQPLHPLDGYFYVEVNGITEEGRVHSLLHKEVEWGGGTGIGKGVFTGSLSTRDFIQYPKIMFKEILLNIQVFNLNQPLSQIVGVDNIALSQVPVPEPSTMLLLGGGLASLGALRWKLKST